MGMNKDAIGKTYDPIDGKVDAHEAMYYALATNDPNPHYIDALIEGGVVAPPMYIIAKELAGLVLGPVLFDTDIGVNFAMLMHGEQKNEWFVPLVHGKKVKIQAKVEDILDKSSGQILIAVVDIKDSSTDEPVARLTSTFFVRGGGTGVKDQKAAAPPEDRSNKVFKEKMDAKKGQTYIYAEASGDHNPIHKDDNFAKSVGLPGIILQGLCTMAFVQKAVVDGACGGDPNKLKSLNVRFKKPVVPGDSLTTLGWSVSEADGVKTIGIETTNQNGDLVIVNAAAEVSA
jgi:acyl dehydratase